MSPLSRRRLLSSIGSLPLAAGFAGCTTTAEGCGEEPPLESRNVESEPGGELPPLGDASWPQPGYDETNARYNPAGTGPEAPARLVWSRSFDTQSTIIPVVEDGTVYVSDESNRLTAIDARTGSTAWRFDGVSTTGPVSAGDGVVFVDDGNSLHAIDTERQEIRWTFSPSEDDGTAGSGRPVEAPTVTDSTVYAALGVPTRVYAVDRDTGAERWQTNGDGVACADDDAIYVSRGASVTAIDADDGTTRWPASIDAGSTVVANGQVFGVVDPATVAAFEAESGERRWEFERTHELLAPPSVSPKGVFVGTAPTEGGDGGNLYVLDHTSGDRLWCGHLGFEQVRSPSVTDEMVYVPRSNQLLQARSVEDGESRWQFNGEMADFGSVAVAGSAVFAGTRNGSLFALGPA